MTPPPSPLRVKGTEKCSPLFFRSFLHREIEVNTHPGNRKMFYVKKQPCWEKTKEFKSYANCVHTSFTRENLSSPR